MPPMPLQASGLLPLLPSLHTAVQEQQAEMGSMQSQLDSRLPDVEPYLSSLAALEGTYAELPPQPSQLTDDAQAEVEGLVQGVQQVGGRAVLGSAGLSLRSCRWAASAPQQCQLSPPRDDSHHVACTGCCQLLAPAPASAATRPQSLAAAQGTVQREISSAGSHLDDAQEQTVGRLARLRGDYLPQAGKYDSM